MGTTCSSGRLSRRSPNRPCTRSTWRSSQIARGLDLVTFQDHPYQPTFHDTWTLLSFVASRTKQIHVSGNVLNLPLRQPAVLARSAASLDLLSGGRFELGIGAGGFWDAIAAMGGRRLTAGQSIGALEEAITIMREIWATDQRGGVRMDGSATRFTAQSAALRPRTTLASGSARISRASST